MIILDRDWIFSKMLLVKWKEGFFRQAEAKNKQNR